MPIKLICLIVTFLLIKTVPVISAQTECGGTFTGNSGTFQTPNHPNDYPENLTCVWSINVDEGRFVKLSIDLGQIEDDEDCAYDYIQINNGAEDKRYCDVIIPFVVKSVSNQMVVTFQSDHNLQFMGFEASYETGLNVDICRSSLTIANDDLVNVYYDSRFAPRIDSTSEEMSMCSCELKESELTNGFNIQYDTTFHNLCGRIANGGVNEGIQMHFERSEAQCSNGMCHNTVTTAFSYISKETEEAILNGRPAEIQNLLPLNLTYRTTYFDTSEFDEVCTDVCVCSNGEDGQPRTTALELSMTFGSIHQREEIMEVEITEVESVSVQCGATAIDSSVISRETVDSASEQTQTKQTNAAFTAGVAAGALILGVVTALIGVILYKRSMKNNGVEAQVGSQQNATNLERISTVYEEPEEYNSPRYKETTVARGKNTIAGNPNATPKTPDYMTLADPNSANTPQPSHDLRKPSYPPYGYLDMCSAQKQAGKLDKTESLAPAPPPLRE